MTMLLSSALHSKSRMTSLCIHSFRRQNISRTIGTIQNQNQNQQQQQQQQVKIVEVGPRDGLQNETQLISTQNKVNLIEGLAKAGCTVIEAGAFVSPKWVPQMADSAQVFQKLKFDNLEQQKHKQRPYLSCLVPNVKGLEQAVQVNVDEIAIFGAASEEFSQRNIACSIDESLNRFRAVVEKATKEYNLPIRGYVSTVVGCPYQGDIPPSQVASVVEKMLALGCYEISLGDTIGVGTPGSIQKMLKEVLMVAKPSQLAMHCHDTYGQALANICVGLEHEIYTIDSSVAGLGGCPYAKGASGNVATEDVVYMLHGMGMTTGIDLEELVVVGESICNVIGRSTQSKVARAMISKRITT